MRGLYSMLGFLRNLWENTVCHLVVVSPEPWSWLLGLCTGLPVHVMACMWSYHNVTLPPRMSASMLSRE